MALMDLWTSSNVPEGGQFCVGGRLLLMPYIPLPTQAANLPSRFSPLPAQAANLPSRFSTSALLSGSASAPYDQNFVKAMVDFDSPVGLRT